MQICNMYVLVETVEMLLFISNFVGCKRNMDYTDLQGFVVAKQRVIYKLQIRTQNRPIASGFEYI